MIIGLIIGIVGLLGFVTAQLDSIVKELNAIHVLLIRVKHNIP